MFSGWANFFLGNKENVAEEHYGASLEGIDVEDGWVLLEKDGSDCGSDENALSVRIPTLGIEDDPSPRLPAGLANDESWFLTPPPCFTSEGPVHMETSPLENLLIEHPSMSVYQQQQIRIRRIPMAVSPSMRRRNSLSGSTSENSEPEMSSPDLRPASPSANSPAPNRSQRTLQARPENIIRRETLADITRDIEKKSRRRLYDSLKRNTLERANKARIVNSRNKRPRRADHMRNHSGANNNRKCC